MASAITWIYDEYDERILWLKQQVFSNHLILERLVLAVHSDDLNAFRMVCRPWYIASLERFQKEVTIVLLGGSNETLRQLGREKEGVPKIEMCELSSELEKSRKLFGQERKMRFQNWKIKYGFLGISNKYCALDRGYIWPLYYPFLDFWVEFGSQIRHLTIENCVLTWSWVLIMRPLSRATCKLEKLESLVLNNVHVRKGGDSFDDPLTLIPRPGFNNSSSNIKRLVIYSYFNEYDKYGTLSNCLDLKELDIDITDCKSMLRDYTLEPLESIWYELPIPFLSTKRSCYGLISLNYPQLESLSLHLEPDISDYTIKLILETYADRLKILKLTRYPFANSPAFQTFPFTNTIFVGLTHLELTGNLTSNFNFLALTPSLRTLVIDVLSYGKVPCIKYDERDPRGHYIVYYWAFFPVPCPNIHTIKKLGESLYNDTCSQLVSYYKPFSGNMVEASDQLGQTVPPFLHQNLQHLQVDIEFDTASLSTLALWLPNISTLKTILNNDTLGCVCYHWPKLQHLKLLFGSAVDDNGLRGVHTRPSSLTKIKTSSSYSFGTRLLVHMDNLHHFELENLCGTPQLTDESAQHVFMKMPKLHFLIICSAQMTELAIKNLAWIIPCVQIGSHAGNNKLKCCGYTQFLRRIGRLSV